MTPEDVAKPTVGVSMLKAFEASGDTGAETLYYPNLEAKAFEATQKEVALLNEFWVAPEGSLQEEKIARSASLGYLVLTGNQLRNVNHVAQPLITDRFTQSFIEIYGEPDRDDAHRLMVRQYRNLAKSIDDPNVDQDRLASTLIILGGAINENFDTDPNKEQEIQGIAEQFKQILEARYGKALELFDPIEAAGVKIDLESIKALFEQGISVLKEDEPGWDGWTVVIANGEGMSTDSKNKQIKIGRSGNYLPERLKPLFAHEALVHGLRSINGYKHDTMLGKGLPGNLDVEEGAGVFNEFALVGAIPERIYDRYIDTSLALGQLSSPAMNRAQMHEFMVNRRVVRDQAAGKAVDIEETAAKTWNAVDRIYRGTLGNGIIGVNTKDIAYYQGFMKYVDYLKDQIEVQGKSAEEVFDYIMLGCFDPADPRHREYVAKYAPAA